MTQVASVILLNYNTCALVIDSLRRIAEDLLQSDWQVIVVDNGSSDGSALEISTQFPKVTLLTNEKNVGFAAGNNIGLRQARGDAVVLLNTDVVVTASQLQDMVDYLRRHPDVGIVSPGLRTPEGAPQAFAFGSDPSPLYLFQRGLRRLLGKEPMHQWDIQSPIDVDWVSAACVAVRTSAFKQAGELDEQFFLYFEDVDWCDRIRQAGWRVVFNPTIQVVHVGGQSGSTETATSQHYGTSLRTYYRKYYPYIPSWLLNTALHVYRKLMST